MAGKKRFTPVALLLGVSLACLLVPGASGLAQAPDFPTRPITFVVGFAPGGGADVFARALDGNLYHPWWNGTWDHP